MTSKCYVKRGRNYYIVTLFVAILLHFENLYLKLKSKCPFLICPFYCIVLFSASEPSLRGDDETKINLAENLRLKKLILPPLSILLCNGYLQHDGSGYDGLRRLLYHLYIIPRNNLLKDVVAFLYGAYLSWMEERVGSAILRVKITVTIVAVFIAVTMAVTLQFPLSVSLSVTMEVNLAVPYPMNYTFLRLILTIRTRVRTSL